MAATCYMYVSLYACQKFIGLYAIALLNIKLYSVDRCLRLFGHIAHSSPQEDHHRAVAAVILGLPPCTLEVTVRKT